VMGTSFPLEFSDITRQKLNMPQYGDWRLRFFC
jgi:hypothetical protein